MRRPDHRWRQALRAAFGGLRLALGILWLKSYVRLKSDREPRRLFQSAWNAAHRLGWLFAGAESYRNRFGRNWRERLLLLLLDELDRRGLAYRPSCRVRGTELLLAGAAGTRGALVVTMHSPVDAVLNRLFRESGIASSLLVDRAQAINAKARLLGLDGELDTIGRTSDALLLMRRKLGEGRLICACVDFTWPRPNSFQVDLCISPAMFELARTLRTPLIYAEAWVSANGEIEVEFGQPALDPDSCTAGALGNDFIGWLQHSLNDRRPMRMQKWQRKARRRSGLLKLPVATARPDQ